MLLVTGGTGFIGSRLVPKLLEEDYPVILLSRRAELAKQMFPKAMVAKGDILDSEILKKLSKGVTQIIHLAGLVSYSKPKEEIFRINIDGTENILDCLPNAERLVFSSSVSVYGEKKGVTKEMDPRIPFNAYGESKMEAENSVFHSNIPSIVLRLAPIYGAGSSSWMKNLGLLEKNFPLFHTHNFTHIVHVTDVVQSILLSLKTRRKGVYNIADREPVKFMKLALTLLNYLGQRPKVYPKWLVKFGASTKGMGDYLKVLTMHRHYSIEKAKRDLGYFPEAQFDLEVKKMVDWYLQSKPKEPLIPADEVQELMEESEEPKY